MLYSGKPDLSGDGLRRCRPVYTGLLDEDDEPDQALIEATAATVLGEGVTADDPVILDIEAYSLDIRATSEGAVTANQEKMRQALAWFKAAAPSLTVGYYAYPPLRDYFTPVLRVPANVAAWKNADTFLQPLANAGDALFPSLYTFFQDQAGWVTYAYENIAEAKRLAGGKPVIPFIWPQIHSVEMTGDFLSGAYWTLILNTIREAGCQGAIIWGPPNVAWDDEAEWWVATKAFLEAL